MNSTYESITIEICSDCLMLIANGDIGDHGDGYPGMTGDGAGDHIYNRPDDDQDENPTSRHAALVDAEWPHADGWELVPGDGDRGFSHSACDGCGVALGGDRYEATAMKQTKG